MKRIYPRLLALLLVVVLAGCDMKSPDEPEQDTTAIPSGRYVEEQLALPPEVQNVKDIVRRLGAADDGSLYLFASTDSPDAGPWALWASQDDGSTWNAQAYPWIAELDGVRVGQIASSGDGTFYMLLYEGGDEANLPEVRLAKADTGALEYMEYALPEGPYGLPPVDMLVAENGNLLLIHSYEIFYVDSGTGELLRAISDLRPGFYGGDASESGGIMYLAGREGITQIDLETGAEVGAAVSAPRTSQYYMSYYEAQHGHRVLTVHRPDGAIYYCDNSGLYRTLPGAPVTELLLGGEQSVLIMPTMVPHQLLVLPGDRYLVLGKNGAEGNVLYRYAYDPDIPSEPSETLRVYSLDDNATIRQAVGVFQRDVPTVKVRYQVGGQDNAGLTAGDALRALSTEILAGDGPDILVLDGMPVDSYIGQGVLADLGGTLGARLQSGYLGNIVEAYRVDDKLYAVPARFAVPMLLAPESAQGVQDVHRFADWLETQESPRIKYTAPAALLEQFYSTQVNTFFLPDGSFDAGEYIRFLESLERLSQHEDLFNEMLEAMPAEFSSELNAVTWAGGLLTAHVGEMNSMLTAVAANQAMEERGGGTYHPMGEVYIPQTILGINARASQPEMAVRFLETVLSDRVLANDFGDGLPVNIEALNQNMQNPDPGSDYVSSYWLDSKAGEAELLIAWPKDTSFFSGLLGQMNTLRIPVQSSAATRSLILEESLLCLQGEKTREEAAGDLKQKMDLLADEQG